MSELNMDIKIDLYSKIYHLEQEFTTARSSIRKKEILFLVFKSENVDQFVFELPLSPSMGSMPIDIYKEFHYWQNKKINRKQLSNKYINSAISYFVNLIMFKKSLPVFEPMKIYNFSTIPISKDQLKLDHFQSAISIPRFKGSADNLDWLIHFSKSTDLKWAVDFNASLNQDNFINFSKRVNFDNCVYIEQPLPVGEFNYELKSYCNTIVFADEELKGLSPSNYDLNLWDGFSLKPINYDFDELMSWLYFAQLNKINYFIGSQINDLIDQSFSNCWNFCSTWQLKLAPIHKQYYYLCPQNTMKLNSETFEYIKNTSKYISTLNLTI